MHLYYLWSICGLRPPLSKIFYYMCGLFLQRKTATLQSSVDRNFGGVSFSIWVFFHEHSRFTGQGGGYFFKSSLPLSPPSQILRHQLDDYCRELTSSHSQQPDSNGKSLVSECKSLATKLRALSIIVYHKKVPDYAPSTVMIT